MCDAYPAPGARRPRGGGGVKGSGGKGGGDARVKGHVGKGNNSNGKGGAQLGDYAYRQLQLQRSHEAKAAHKASEKELADARKRNDLLQDNYKKLQQELEELKRARAKPPQEDDMDTTAGPSDYSEEERKSRMEKIRNSLPYLEDQFGNESEEYRAAVDELYVHQKALRGAKPYKTHRTILERKLDKLRKQQDREKEHLSELKEAAEEIQSKIDAATTAIEERDRELEAAETELRDLLLRAVGEDASGGQQDQQQTIDPTVGWNSVVETVGRLAQQPGVPAQFSAQLDGLFSQLQQMVSVLSCHAMARGENPLQPSSRTYANVVAGVASGGAQGSDKAGPGNARGDEEMVPQLQPEKADELRQQQRLARQQRKQTNIINHIIGSHRAAQQLQQQQQQQQQQHHQQQQQQQQEQERAQQQAAAAAASAAAATEAAAADGAAAGPGGGDPAQPTPSAVQATQVGGSASSGHIGDGVGELGQGINISIGGPSSVAAEAQHEPAAAAPTLPAEPAGDAQPAVQPEPPSEYGDAESDITGVLSETDGEGMDIEAVLERIPQSQKASVRNLLEARRAKCARKTQRHKKPISEHSAAVTRQTKKK